MCKISADFGEFHPGTVATFGGQVSIAYFGHLWLRQGHCEKCCAVKLVL